MSEQRATPGAGEECGVTEVLVGAAALTTAVKQSIEIGKVIKGSKKSRPPALRGVPPG